MKRKISLLLIILCILVISNLILFAEETKYDFRETNWGMSKEQVKAMEKGEIVLETEREVDFMVPDFDDNFKCGYLFLEDKLYRSLYLFIGEHTNKNDYINDYERLKETLTKQYGKPRLDKVTWKNDLYKDNQQEWGTAIGIGHLSYNAFWETSTTEIILILFSVNSEITLFNAYISKELREWAKEIKEKETSKGL